MSAPMPGVPALSLRGVATRSASDAPAIDVTFEVKRRRITALLGLSGSGKTGTLRAIVGLDPLSAGSVTVAGADVSARAPHLRAVGLVPHGLALAPDLTIADTIRLGLRAARRSVAEREIRLAELLRVVDLAERGDERVGRLSHLEALRVAVARSLTAEPLVLLLDDPLGTLEGAEREAGRLALRALLLRLTLNALLATRDPDDAAALADDVAIIEHGRIVQVGATAAVLARPATVDVARLAGYEVLIQGRAEGDRVSELGVGSVLVPDGIPRDTSIHLMAHPAAILAVPRGHGLGFGVAGRVTYCRPVGPLWLLEVALGSRSTILARWEWDAEPPPIGSQVELTATSGVGVYVANVLHVPPADPQVVVAPRDVSAQPISNTG